MPGLEDQQVLQQLLTGMNTMQMQTGLMPGGIPALHNQNAYTPPATQTPAQFSNSLAVNLRNTFSYQPSPPPMFGGITPVPRTAEAQGILPGPMIGSGWGMARQQAQGGGAQTLTSAQAITGVGARAAFSTGIGIAATPFVGPWGGAAIGFGADMLLGGAVESMASMPFKPLVDRQQRAMQLQNMSLNNIRRGPDMSASGMGLSMTASMDLERQLTRTADNRGFRRDTHGMFNRQDMMKLTDISSQVGLLDNTQSVDQMAREMGKIGRALSTFMKVVEEPDVLKALQTMGNMRNLGMSIPETNVAAANARTYARMAGTSVQGVMQAGMQGAGLFQQYGMSAATGLNVGMAATGVAGNLATTLDPRTLNMLGGREGMSQSLATSSAQMSQISAILPGLLQRGKDGKLAVDTGALSDLMSGKGNIQDLVRASAARMQGPDATKFVNEYSTRRSELHDELMNSMGGMGGTLLPLVLARRVMASGATNDLGAALRISGLDEKQSRTLQALSQSGTLGDTLRQQQQTFDIEQQRVRTMQRESLSTSASSERWHHFGEALAAPAAGMTAGAIGLATGGGLSGFAGAKMGAYGAHQLMRGTRAFGNAAARFMRENYGEDTDLEEQQIAAGGGRVLRTLRPGTLFSDAATKGLRKQFDTDEGIANFLGTLGPTNRDNTIGAEISKYVSERERMGGLNDFEADKAVAERTFIGPGGPGISGIGRGGENIVDTAYRNAPLMTRIRASSAMQRLLPEFALRESGIQIQKRISDQIGTGRILESALANKGPSLREIANTQGVSTSDIAQASSKAATALQRFFKSKFSTIGPGGPFGTEKISPAEIDKIIDEQVKTIPNLTPEKRRQLVEQLRSTAVRNASEGMSSTEKEFLSGLVSGGADLAGSQAAAGQQELLNSAEETRKAGLGRLGIGTGYFDSAESGKAVTEVFSTGGAAGELQQKLLVAKSLDAAAEASGDEKTAQKLKQQAADLRAAIDTETGEGGKYTKEQVAGARSAVEEASGRMDRGHRAGMGQAFSRVISAGKLEGSLADARKTFQTKAPADDFKAAAASLLGDEAASIFTGAPAGERTEKLREYYSGRGDTENLKKIEGLTDEQLARRVQGRMGRTSRGVFAGGLSQQATELSRVDTDIQKAIEKEEAAARADFARDNPVAALGVVVEDFSKATADYGEGAKIILEASQMHGLQTAAGRGATILGGRR